jgi:clan AA aspartic protease
MIQGVVNARLEAVVPLRLRGPSGVELSVDAVVDSGYTGSLTLPPTTVAALRLVCHSTGGAILADGSTQSFDLYAVEVEWDGLWRMVLALSVGGDPLLGMRLLAGHTLRIDVTPGGAVEISSIP